MHNYFTNLQNKLTLDVWLQSISLLTELMNQNNPVKKCQILLIFLCGHDKNSTKKNKKQSKFILKAIMT